MVKTYRPRFRHPYDAANPANLTEAESIAKNLLMQMKRKG
jgi:hypothetical protein